MNIKVIGPCFCGKAGVASYVDGPDLCYRHAKLAMCNDEPVDWASRKDFERAVKELGWTITGTTVLPARPATGEGGRDG